MKNPRRFLGVCLPVLFVVYSATYLALMAKQNRLTDEVSFGGDQWFYQSMAVNFSKGQGFKFGNVFPLETYRFAPPPSDPDAQKFYESFLNAGKRGGENVHVMTRTYSFCMGLVYRVFGVHPLAIKVLQALMFALAAAFLPFIGYFYWKRLGLFAGLLSGPWFLRHCFSAWPYWPAPEIMTESFVIFCLLGVILAAMYFEAVPAIRSSIILGLAFAWGVLGKGLLVFIPVLYLACQLLQTAQKYRAAHIVLVAGFFLLPVLTYSLRVSLRLGKFTFISTQPDMLFRDGNNEQAIDTGIWSPYWRSTPQAQLPFYMRPEIAKKGTLMAVLAFYREYPRALPRILKNKINVAFHAQWMARLLLTILALGMSHSINGFIFQKAPAFKKALDFLAPTAGGIPAFLFLHFHQLLLLFLAFLGISVYLRKRWEVPMYPGVEMPPCFLAAYVNLLLVTLLFFGDPRWVLPFSFLLALHATVASLQYLLVTPITHDTHDVLKVREKSFI